MKPILTFIFILLFGALAVAQNKEPVQKATTDAKGIVWQYTSETQDKEVKIKVDADANLAVVFKFKNSLIKNSLTFTTESQRYRWV